MTQLRQGPAPVDLWCVAGDPCEWTLTIAGDPSSIADPEWTLLRSLGGSAVTGVSSSPSVAGLVATFGLTAAESTALKALGSAAAATTLVQSFALAFDGAADTKEVIAGKLVVLPVGSSVPASSTSLTVNIGAQSIAVTVSLGGDPAAAVAVHTSDTVDAHDASAISFAPTGTLAATDVQAAIAEVASETIQTSVLTTSGDILTRGASAPDRITRASLAADTAFTSQFQSFDWVEDAQAIPAGTLSPTLLAGIDCVSLSVSDVDGYVYGSSALGSKTMVRSGDGFATTDTGATLASTGTLVYAGRVVEGYFAITTLEALYGSPGSNQNYSAGAEIWFSTSWSSGWSKVKDIGRVQGISIGRPVYDSVLGATVCLAGEYSQTAGTTHKLWLSVDGGQTWATIHQMAAVNGAQNNHYHGACFDPWTRRIYASHGDAENGWFGYSSDLGSSWTAIPAAGISGGAYTYHQPTVVAAAEAGIVTAPDGAVGYGGVWMMDRSAGYVTAQIAFGTNLPYDQYAENPVAQSADGRVIYALAPMRGGRTSNTVYVAASGDGGRTWHLAYSGAQGSTEYYERGIVGPDRNGYLYLHCRDDATNKLYRAPQLTWSLVPRSLVRAISGDIRAALVQAGVLSSAAAPNLDLNGGALNAATVTTTGAITAGAKITGTSMDLTGASATLKMGNGATPAGINTFSGTTDVRCQVNGTEAFRWTANEILMAEGKNFKVGTTTGTQIGTQTTQKLGFFAATPIVKPAASGSRGGNAALASLLTALASLGLVVDSTSA